MNVSKLMLQVTRLPAMLQRTDDCTTGTARHAVAGGQNAVSPYSQTRMMHLLNLTISGDGRSWVV
jgi:hypothetical protein